MIIQLDASEEPDVPRFRPLPVSVAERMGFDFPGVQAVGSWSSRLMAAKDAGSCPPAISGGPAGPVAVSRCGPRTWPRKPGGGWKRYLTRARRRGGSTCWPARSRSRSARSPLPGTTGSQGPGSELGRLARRAGPAAPVGPRSLAGTGRRMRRRSGSCWTRLDPPRSRRCSGQQSSASVRGYRARRAAQRQSAGPRPVNGRRRGRQDLPRARRPTVLGSISSASPDTAGTSWTTSARWHATRSGGACHHAVLAALALGV
jgi:hypothetical protein